jgi:hypothetical protein
MNVRFVPFVFALAFLTAVSTHAQTQTPAQTPQAAGATLRALVEDETRYPMPGVAVTLTNDATGVAQEAVTDSSGRVVFRRLAPGSYTIRAAPQGFNILERPVAVTTGTLPLVRLTLTIQEITQEVTVTGISRTDDRTSAEQNADAINVDDDILQSVPVPLQSQSLMNFIGTYLTGSAQGTDEITILVDGVQHNALTIPLPAVRRILINKNPYGAEYRRPGKARVEIITMDGSRRHYHGLAGFTFGNTGLDARPAFGTDKPGSTRHLTDLSFGGPLFGSRASYFFSLERMVDNPHHFVRAVTPWAGPVNTVVNGRDSETLGVARMDLRPDDTTRFTFRYDMAQERKLNSGAGDFALPEVAGDNGDDYDEFRFASSSVFSPSFNNEFRFNYERKRVWEGEPILGPKIEVDDAFESGYNQAHVRENVDTFEVQNVSSYYRGAHAFRFGGRFRPKSASIEDRSYAGGVFTFRNLAAYEAGTPYLFEYMEGDPSASFKEREADLFFQDEIKFHPDWSLMLGARWDWQNVIKDNNNVAPRVALSWAVTPKTVIRTGAGVFYERATHKIVQYTRFRDGVRQREILITNPSYPDPFEAGDSRTTPAKVYRLGSNLDTPHLTQAGISFERQLWRERTLLTIEYAHLRGVNLFRGIDVNAPPPGSRGVRPDPNFSKIVQVNTDGGMKSDGVAVSFRGRMADWFKGSIYYLYSRSYGNVGGSEPGPGSAFATPADNFNLAAEWGRTGWDARHRFNTTAVFDIPRGFRVGLLFQAHSGEPYEITTGTDDNLDGSFNDRPVGVTRNSAEGLGFAQLDLRLAKIFMLSNPFGEAEEGELEFNMDVLNVLNSPNYTNIVGVMTSRFFGQARGASDPRVVTFTMRYKF